MLTFVNERRSMQPLPAFPTSPAAPLSSPPAATQTKRRRTGLWLGIGTGAAIVVVLGIAVLLTKPAENRGDYFPDLPEWFDRAHRIRAAEQVISVEGIGMLLPPPISPSHEFNSNWLEKNFTHYVADDAFVWATPKFEYPSHGNILAGTKVISSGKQVEKFTLACAVTNDGCAINFFME